MVERGDNTILVGKKPPMAYVLAAITQFSDGQDEIHIKARGRCISNAVDVSQIIKNKFIKDAKITNVEIGTETIESEGKQMNVSTIDITIRRS
jgi:DNA-binding protein